MFVVTTTVHSNNGALIMRYSLDRRAKGDEAEEAFASHPDVEFIRAATTYEDKYLRFDMIVDLGWGDIPTDVKSFNPNRKHNDKAYLELVNNYGYPGWAIPNAVADRYVTWELPGSWMTVHIIHINDIVESNEYKAKEYRYGASLMMVPFDILRGSKQFNS